ncbi:MAG: RHS repeat-associated core domain-containing protein, partial [bacterium]
MELLYQQTENEINNQAVFNGSISAIKWKGPGIAQGQIGQRSYTYQYDKSDRLMSANFAARGQSSWNQEINTLNETISYDANGNILQLNRNHNNRSLGANGIINTAETLDNLSYNYNNGNKLIQIEDAVPQATGAGDFKNTASNATEYAFNTDGSVTRDDNKGISNIVYNYLGKPLEVIYQNGKRVTYSYDATGSKLCIQTWQGSNLLTKTDYVGSFVYESNQLAFFGSPEGRVVRKGSAFEYQYAIADHQGNTRVLFTSATPQPEVIAIDFETETHPQVEINNRTEFDLFDHSDAGNTKRFSQMLTGAAGSNIGLAKSYKVMAGDKVKIEAWAKYLDVTNNTPNIGNFAEALTGAFGLSSVSTGEALKAYQALNGVGTLFETGGAYSGSNNGYPKLYVNILLFDHNFKLLDLAMQQIDGGAQPTGTATNYPHDYLTAEITAPESGYAFVFISNDNTTFIQGYFDDVVMTYTPTNILQYNEYYPFGLQTANSWTRDSTSNVYLYNAGSEFNSATGNYEMAFREYDPAIGRMTAIDPMASRYASLSPYNYSYNDPVYWNDPSGA